MIYGVYENLQIPTIAEFGGKLAQNGGYLFVSSSYDSDIAEAV